jgi:hypothetical protein
MDETGNIICNWDTSVWKTTDEDTVVEGSDNAIDSKAYPVHILGGNYDAYQSIEKPSRIGKYTLSGWVRSDTTDTEGTLDLVISNCDKDGNLESATDSEGNPRLWVADNSALNENQGSVKFTDEWKYFEYTIAINSEVDYFKVEFRSDRGFYMWHAMFEQGSVATTWQPSPQDDEAAVVNANGIYDKYLSQDKIFNKLIKDPVTGKDMVGIWMIPVEDAYGSRKELYINATYIAAGILRSSNWDGTLKIERVAKKVLVKNNDGTMKEEVVKDENGNTVYIDSYTINTNPS